MDRLAEDGIGLVSNWTDEDSYFWYCSRVFTAAALDTQVAIRSE